MDRVKSIIFLLPFFVFACGSESNEDSTKETNTTEEDTIVIVEDEEEVKIEIPHFGSNDGMCFEKPNDRFIQWIENDSIYHIFPVGENIIYSYLTTHCDSIAPKKIIKTDPDWGPTEWEQTFTNGMTFGQQSHPEAGSDYYLKTRCEDKSAFLKNFMILIEDPENFWNEDSTTYGPDGAGCGYNFKWSEDSTIIVDWYCGC
ncbi:hypothetical protein K6119_14755 [Paracrocinitomix mangrovi]|uniref:hypothetical protein n=1 Tax=Paracrocinitomix mangrovi TaxID=2862509 RepID=UPI001C8E73A1|nr:hypothetical protein [Paracrocinitomix mangrovi]UKN00993.1 hypothetical protein K6119_14755 [Paracrocinitomix mangrovi]